MTERPRNPTEPVHEYAGWRYRMVLDADGNAVQAHLMPGENPNGNKQKHLHAAVEDYNSLLD